MWIAAAAAILDQITKAIVRRGATFRLDGLFAIRLTHNTGVAFSMFSGSGLALILLTALLIALLTGWLIAKSAELPKWSRIGLWLIVGGGLGNLYDRIVDKNLLIRRMNLTVNRVVPESEAAEEPEYEQMDLFTDYAALAKEQEKEKAELEKERLMQKTMLDIRKKFGKNAVLKGINFEEGATGRERNRQIGGHQA